MTLLIPLGLLGLAAIGVLILIWIIKPNYQQKFISSTYVWRLSLKLKRKKVPISKLRNLLLILCQVLFLAACALALAQPALITKAVITEREVIAIIDSSASMRAGYGTENRFDRAVMSASDLVSEVFDEEGIVTVIVAGPEPEIIAQRYTAERRESVQETLDALISDDACSYGSSDIDAAMALCENIITDNANAEIYLFTDTTYSYVPSSVHVVDITETDEWNAGILDAYTVLEENYYSVFIDVACYGVNDEIPLKVEVYGANANSSEDQGETVIFETDVACTNDETMTVVFRNGNIQPEGYEENDTSVIFIPIEDNRQFYSYTNIHISIATDDAFSNDDTFDIYEGLKETLRVQYSSSQPNPFIPGILESIANNYRNKKNLWDIRIVETTPEKAATEGYDLYIFEHLMPETMPKDGVVVLWDLDSVPAGLDITLGGVQSLDGIGLNLTQESDDSPLLNNINVGNLTISSFTTIRSYNTDEFEVLMSCDNNPVMLAKNDGDSKVILLPFSVQYSNISIEILSFSALFYNIFETYIPATIVGNSFAVYEDVTLNCRGDELRVIGAGEEFTFTEFPATLHLNLPGVYTLSQTTDFGKNVTEMIYVTIPSAESNIWSKEDAFRNPYLVQPDENYYDDLILYIAAAMVALLFIEWILQSRESM